MFRSQPGCGWLAAGTALGFTTIVLSENAVFCIVVSVQHRGTVNEWIVEFFVKYKICILFLMPSHIGLGPYT